jgi:peroxiredoxin
MSMMSIEPGAEAYPRRLHELEQRFASLEPQIPDSPQKEALAVLHGMVHELWRNLRAPARRSFGLDNSPDAPARDGTDHDPAAGHSVSPRGLTLRDVAELYRNAPKMEAPAESQPLPPGTRAPDFALPDASGRLVRLSDYRGRPVVLVFYPLDWSPGCSQLLDLYQAECEEFERRGAQLLAVSVDSIYSHGAWAAVRGLRFPLLSDFAPKGEVARRYQVWRERDGFSERALYVIDGDGVVRFSHVSPYLHHVPDIYDLLRQVDAVAAGGRDSSAEARVTGAAQAAGGVR